MQIEQIDTFLDLCETRSFNKTAERLGVTQSTVSGRMKALERVLDCRLLERSRSGTALTTEGLSFEPHARALRLTWSDACDAVRQAGGVGMTLRVGLQHDLMGDHIADWVGLLRDALPEAALYVDADFSSQMCSDVMEGRKDLAVIFTPTAHPDLYFETLGEVAYQMVSTEPISCADVARERYFLPNYSPAFSRTHHQLLPELASGAVSSGQSAVIQGLLMSLGGASYLRAETAEPLIAAGALFQVDGAPVIGQPVYAVVHLRNRHRRAHRRIVEVMRRQIPGMGPR